MHAIAVVLHDKCALALEPVKLVSPTETDVIVDMEWSGISSGTERLLWSGRMPPFPGMGYPLVPGYESVGRVVQAGASSNRREGDRVFVPGARCYDGVRALFGGTSSRVVVAGQRVWPVSETIGENAILLALTATAVHALAAPGSAAPDLIVGHGVLGRLLGRVTVALGNEAPTVWEHNPSRMDGATGYVVIDPTADQKRTYHAIYDVSGDSGILGSLISRLAPGGEIVLAGFYDTPLSFDFAPAFMREARIRVAAQFLDDDMRVALDLINTGRLSLDGLISHRQPATSAPSAYDFAFTDPNCLKMVLDWRASA